MQVARKELELGPTKAKRVELVAYVDDAGKIQGNHVYAILETGTIQIRVRSLERECLFIQGEPLKGTAQVNVFHSFQVHPASMVGIDNVPKPL
jgi:hypothetical protein